MNDARSSVPDPQRGFGDADQGEIGGEAVADESEGGKVESRTKRPM
jgi:hypothetical protein